MVHPGPIAETLSATMKYLPTLRRPTTSTASERRTQQRDQREIWTPSMREDFRMQEFLSGVQVHDIEWSEWQDSLLEFQQH